MRIVTLLLLIDIYTSAFSQVDTIVWQRLSSLPDSNQIVGSGYFLIDSNFYVAGGQVGISNSTGNNVWRYNIPSDSWFRMGNLPFGSSSCGGYFVLNNKGYFLTSRDSLNQGNCDTMLWEYNPIGDNWIRRAGIPDNARQGSSVFSYNNKGYLGQTEGCIADDSHFWEYDPAQNNWSAIATLPKNLVGGSIAVANLSPNVYLLDGYDPNSTFYNDLWRYNIGGDHWDSLGQMPGSARAFPIAWMFDSIIIGGGGTDWSTLFTDFYRYNIAIGLWSPIIFQNSFDSAGAGFSFVYHKRGYYFGGFSTINPNETFNNNMWSFDASRYIHDTNVGIAEVKNEATFTVYPNPVSRDKGFSISTSESGEIVFCDALGRVVDTRRLVQGLNAISLSTENEVLFYRATLHDGDTRNGKIVVLN